MAKQRAKKFRRYPCNDCRRDCARIGHWYMAETNLWEKQLGLGWKDNLCLDCLEKRLGRPLRGWDDVTPASTQLPFQLSPRLPALWGFTTRRRRKRQPGEVIINLCKV
jgi:hypothetical protein